MKKMLKFLFGLYLFAYPFGQLNRFSFSFPAPEVNFYLTDLLAGILIFVWWLKKLKNKEKIKKTTLEKPFFLFTLLAFVSLLGSLSLFSFKEVLVGGLYWLRWVIYGGFFFFWVSEKKKIDPHKKFLKIMLILGVMIGIFGLIQFLFWPDLKPLSVYGWDPHYFRVVGSFLDPGFTGLILALSLLLFFDLYWPLISKGKLRLKHFFLFGLIYLPLILTYSRSAYLALLTGTAIFTGKKKAIRFGLVIFLLFLSTILVVSKPVGEGGRLLRTYSLITRVISWQEAVEIGLKRPFLGIGFNTYRYAKRDYSFLHDENWQLTHAGGGADSSFFLVFATTGIFGALAFYFLGAKLALSAQKNSLALATLGAVFAHGWFLNSFFYPWIMSWLWLILAQRFKGNN